MTADPLSGFNVAIVNDHPSHVGIGEYSVNLYSAVKALGLPVRLFQFTTDAHAPALVPDQVTVLGPGFPLLPGREINTILGNNWRKFKGVKASVVHLSGPTLAPLCSYIANSILTVHDLCYLQYRSNSAIYSIFQRHWIERIRTASTIVCPSESTRSQVLGFTRASGERVWRIPNAVDLTCFTPGTSQWKNRSGMSPRKRIILHVGHDQPVKNTGTVLRVLAKLPDDFVLVRVGWTSRSTLRLAKSLGVSSRIRGVRDVNRSELADIYRASEVVLLPSLCEGFGRPAVEGLACGIPTAVSDRGSLPEVTSGLAYVGRPYDVDGFVAWILRPRSADDLNTLRKAGPAHAARFGPQSVAEHLRLLYSRLPEWQEVAG